MPIELVGSNVVIVARQFNPSIVSQLWLVRNGIVAESEFRPGCLFSDEVAKVESDQFGLMLVQPQLQFIPRTPLGSQAGIVSTKLGAIVERLPETPYTAVGLNFTWHIWPTEGETRHLARSLFHVEDRPIHRCFNSDDASFGAYLSKNVIGCRLKLDIKPLDVEVQGNSVSRIQFAFNFHLSLNKEQDLTPQILEQLRRWDEARLLADEIVHDLGELGD